MELKTFKEELEKRDGVSFGDNYVLFSDYELYNLTNDESKIFRTFEDLLDYTIDKKTIRELIDERETMEEQEYGGRGSSSGGSRGNLFSGRGSGRNGRRGEPGKGLLPPAYINTLTSSNKRTVESMTKAFGKNLINADREYAALLDKNGYALEYTKGQKTSVTHLERKGAWSIHNHPTKKLGKGWSNAFSGQDLKNWALGNGKGTIVVASGNRTAYMVTKNQRFNSKKFIKAMNSASTSKGYDKGVDQFLKKNQREMGYKYSKFKF